MIKRGQKAIVRSKRKRREKLDRYNKYIKNYKYLASIADKKMGRMKIEANKLIERWMNIKELDIILEEEEPPDEPPDRPPEVIERSGDRGLDHEAPKANNLEPGPRENEHKSKVKTLTDYFDRLGGHKTPRTPNKTTKLLQGI